MREYKIRVSTECVRPPQCHTYIYVHFPLLPSLKQDSSYLLRHVGI
ncbi:unnamed protein product, partial [Vitis vinifera]|uniref:Uncharacterized protein n=1 Tax=Vitis vinifera TaxID=29760 RepID=D7SHI4_VITVI